MKRKSGQNPEITKNWKPATLAIRGGTARSEYGETSEALFLTSGYSSQGGDLARLGVLGPTRMDYSNNMAAVRAVARYLSRLLE